MLNYDISVFFKRSTKNVNIFIIMSVQTIHFFRPPPLQVYRPTFLGAKKLGFTHKMYCAATKINPSFKPV